jgi:hypothetical protein
VFYRILDYLYHLRTAMNTTGPCRVNHLFALATVSHLNHHLSIFSASSILSSQSAIWNLWNCSNVIFWLLILLYACLWREFNRLLLRPSPSQAILHRSQRFDTLNSLGS